MSDWQIAVRWDAARLSPNKTVRMRPGHKGRLISDCKQAGAIAWLEAGQPRAAGPVEVSVIVRRGRAMDEDNLRAGLKWLADALFKGRITPDDGPAWVSWGRLSVESGAQHRGCERVVFVIRETTAPSRQKELRDDGEREQADV